MNTGERAPVDEEPQATRDVALAPSARQWSQHVIAQMVKQVFRSVHRLIVLAALLAAAAARPDESVPIPRPPAPEPPAALVLPLAPPAVALALAPPPTAPGPTLAPTAPAVPPSALELSLVPPPLAPAPPPSQTLDATGPNYVVPAVETVLMTGVMIGWNVSVGSAAWARVDGDTIGRNLRSEWVLDQDRFWINQVGHPYQGIIPFSAARSAGVPFWASGAYSFAQSLAWEVAGETTLPSVNDQVTTPVSGVVLGEALHRISGMILEGGRSPWRIAAASLFAPIETGNRWMLGTEPEPYSPKSRFVGRFGARTVDAGSDPKLRSTVVADLGARLTYGIPGDPSLQLEQPFDRFELEASYSGEADPVATVLGRGVVAGSTFDEGDLRGLTGVVLQFDFNALGRIPVSTSAVGLSAEARWDVGPELSLEGTAVASAVILGAAGFLPDRGAHERTYRMGPGAQGQLDLELRALDRLAARVGARQYAIVGMGGPSGVERVTYATGSLLVRLFGQSGVGVEGQYAYRAASPGYGSLTSDAAHVVRVFYALGNDAMTR